MTYQQLKSLLPNDEIHYLSDDNHNLLLQKQFNNILKFLNKYQNLYYMNIQYMISQKPEINSDITSIKHSVYTDNNDMDYIMI